MDLHNGEKNNPVNPLIGRIGVQNTVPTIYYAGNPLLAEDALPFRLIPLLQERFPNIDFKHHDPNENLVIPEKQAGIPDLIIIDTVINADKVITISDEKQLATESVYSPHDWDIALNLKLLLKLGQLESFLIIGVPPEGNINTIFDCVADIINNQDTRHKE